MTTLFSHTGVIAQRDYGLYIRSRQGLLFASPIRYAMGLAIVQTPAQLQTRLAQLEKGEALENLVEALRKGVLREEGTTNLLDAGGKKAIRKVKAYTGDMYKADVLSSSGEEREWHEVFLAAREDDGAFTHFHARDQSKDSRWSDVKIGDVISKYGAAFDTALSLDRTSRVGATANMTGLTNARNLPAWSLPFDFVTGAPPGSERSKLATELFVSYYTSSKPRYAALSKQALSTDALFTNATRESLERGRAVFGVERQRAVQPKGFTETDRRLQRAATLLEYRMMQDIEGSKRPFHFEGYALEFKGSPFEVVAKRYRAGNVVYHVCRGWDLPPIVVTRFLGLPAEHPHLSRDPMPSVHPLRRPAEGYISADDGSRRVGMTYIVAPDAPKFSHLPVPSNLQDKYRQLRAG